MLCKRKVFNLNQASPKQPVIIKGLVFAALSGVCLSLVGVLVKNIKNLHPGQLALYRFIATTAMTLPELAKIGHSSFGPNGSRLLLVLMGVLGGPAMYLNFIAFRYLGLGEASVIIFSSPVFVTIFARMFLKEPCDIFQPFTVILTLIGIIFTTKLPSRLTESHIIYSSEKTFGIVAAVLSAFSVVAIQLLARKMTHVHQSVKTFNYSWIGSLLIAVLTAVFGNFQWQQCGSQSIYILLLALLSYCGLTLMFLAFQCELAGPVATMRAAAEISAAFLWQIIIFHDIPDLYGIIGAVLVTVSLILIGLGKWLRC